MRDFVRFSNFGEWMGMSIYNEAINKGLEGVVVCDTAISSIVDATLCYRGYAIEDLVAHSHFEEIIFLLWKARLPQKQELKAFKAKLVRGMSFSPDLLKALNNLPVKGVHPMCWLRSALSLLAHERKEPPVTGDLSVLWDEGLNITAKMPLLISYFSRKRKGKKLLSPVPEQGLAWNFLYTLQGKEPEQDWVKGFDTCLVLHADHELNCSAFAARVTASSLSDLYSAMVSAVGTLKGPLHGGANEQVMLMLKEVGSMKKISPWLKKALSEKKKIMGFGHRVYKKGDPRAKVLKQMSKTFCEKIGQPHWFEMSCFLEDELRRRKGLLPNVDFYSATVYYAMGIPIDLYTSIFAVSRVSGWIAHCMEQYQKNRIYRPRGEWSGPRGLKWRPMEERA